MAKFKGVAFDLDGVITDTAYYHAKAWRILCEKLDIQWNDLLEHGTKGISRYDSLMLILSEGNKQNDFSEKEIQEMLVWKNDLYKKLIEELTPKDILPGISKLLSDLKDAGYPIVLASASFNAPMILDKLGLKEMFLGIVDPGSLENGKPAPDIYLAAAELMSVAPSDMLGVEDAKSGVEAINAAGGMSVGVGNCDTLKEADFCVSDTSGLTLEVLERRFK